ncbi:MAG: carbohydrate kinase family protein [Trueperaceae bacterium]|nr:carbohydrate kinase family protein [Trueperaceae bacterium]
MSTPLWVVGDYAWDVLIRTNRPLMAGGDTYGEVGLAPGGSAANSAVWARRCGLPTTFVGKVGRDRLGDLAEEELEAEDVGAWLVRSEAQATGSVAVWIDHEGQRSMVSGKGADHHLLPSELPREALAGARHLHLSAWSFFADPPRAAAREAARIAKAAGATLSFDPGSFQLIGSTGVDRFLRFTNDLGIDLLFPNVEEGRVLSGETDPERMVAVLAERYPGARIVLKLDAQGALVQDDQGRPARVPPTQSVVLDATGAGDAFAGAFLARWSAGEDAVEAARFASGVAAWVIEHLGARPHPDARLRERMALAHGTGAGAAAEDDPAPPADEAKG